MFLKIKKCFAVLKSKMFKNAAELGNQVMSCSNLVSRVSNIPSIPREERERRHFNFNEKLKTKAVF